MAACFAASAFCCVHSSKLFPDISIANPSGASIFPLALSASPVRVCKIFPPVSIHPYSDESSSSTRIACDPTTSKEAVSPRNIGAATGSISLKAVQ